MSKEVFIVDDDRGVVKLLERVISELGYPTRSAHDGENALRMIREARPGLVLLDLLLPGQDGRAVLARLRGSPDTKDLPVIAMTGVFRGRSHAQELEKAGAQGFLEKPFRRSALVPLLQRHLGRPRGASAQGAERASASLVDEPVPALIWQAMNEKFTGALVFESGPRRKTLVLREGEPIEVGSNVARECLGNRLLASGQIDTRALQESLRRARAGEGKQGEILVGLGAISQTEVDRALIRQAEEKLVDLFSWNDGEMTREPGTGDVPRASSLEGWTPRELILRGVQLMNRQRVERILSRYRDETVARTGAELGERESVISGVAEVLRAVDCGTSVGALLQEYGALLYGLGLVGAVSFSPAGKLAETDAQEPKLSELRALAGKMHTLDHFEVLGLERDARAEAVHEAFVALARRFHPDRFPADLRDARELASAVFARISDANAVLSDPATRRQYVEALQRGSTLEDDRKQVNQVVSAESQFQRGETRFRKREYAEALEHFKLALELNPNEGDFHAYFGWTHFLVHRDGPGSDPPLVRRHLDRGTQLAPNSATVFYLDGLYRKASEDMQGAERLFRKALQLAPEHVEANREMRLLNMRRERVSDRVRELFGFGRKKS